MRRRSARKKSAADLLVTPQKPAEKAAESQSPEGFKFDFDNFRTSAKMTPPLASHKKQRNKRNVLESSSSGKLSGPSSSSPAPRKMGNLSGISDLTEMASSRLDSIKRYLDHSHSEIFKDLEASQSRLHKRLKETQVSHHGHIAVDFEANVCSLDNARKNGKNLLRTAYHVVPSATTAVISLAGSYIAGVGVLSIQTQACQQVVNEAEKEYKKMSDRIGEGREAMKASYSEFMAEVQAGSSRVFKSSLPELLQSFERAIDSLRSRHGLESASAC